MDHVSETESDGSLVEVVSSLEGVPLITLSDSDDVIPPSPNCRASRLRLKLHKSSGRCPVYPAK